MEGIINMSYHAPLSASSLPRILLCPASFKMSLGMPNKPNPAAERGTRIHEMADLLWDNEEPDTDDQEGLQWAKDYLEYIKGIKGDAVLEISLDSTLRTVHPLLGGTADALITNETELHIVDLKTGRGVVKTDSIQLKAYALGAWIRLDRPQITVFAHIYQPHYAQQLPAQYSYNDMVQFEAELKALAEQATDPFVQPTPSYDSCRYCLGKTVCPAIKDLAIKTAQTDFNLQTDMPDLPELLDTAEVLEGWIQAVREAAKDIMNTGGFVANWELSKGRKMSKIRNETEVIAHFEGNQRLYTLKSLTQLKKDGFEIPERFIEESLSAPSLKRSS